MLTQRLRPRVAAIGTAVALAAAGVLATASPSLAVTAPGTLKASVRNSSTVVLSWTGPHAAQGYDLQVDNDPAYGSVEYQTTTPNTRAVPTTQLKPGLNHWRVRTVTSSGQSAWKSGSFTIAPVGTPIPQSPANNAVLAQPQDPPLLQWGGVQGAVSYVVEVDSDSDFIGAKTYTTRTTSLVVPDPLTTGDWYWRVTADKGNGLVSLPSAVSQFTIQPLALPQITYPPNDVNQSMEDVVLDWTPVPGAATYDVQVALDSDFNNIALNATNIRATRFSPTPTLNNDQFWWRVRAVDLAGQPTPWTTSLYGFQRLWPETSTPTYPIGTPLAPGSYTDGKQFYEWSPVKHATRYELQVSPNLNFSPAVTQSCYTASTTYTPRNGLNYGNDCGYPSGSTVYYWRVRPLDSPYPGPLPGFWSATQAFTYTPPAPPSGSWDPQAQVSGLRIALTGTGIQNGQGCAGTSPDDTCAGVPSTPVLSWNPVPGASFYMVYYGQDAAFTTSTVPNIPLTSNTIFQLRNGDSTSSLPDSQAGSAYYWHVRPCASLADCGPDPESHVVFSDTRSFRKASPAIQSPSTSDPSASEISFSWADYYNTNVNTSWGGQTSNQTAKTYRIQVATDPSFSNLVDTREVDQATYTAPDRLYPEGTYYWRVQAVDDAGNGLTWSPVASFKKQSPAVTQTSPVGGVSVSGTAPFRWAAQAFAQGYQIEVYKNNDTTLSPANRIISDNTRATAYTPLSPIPASSLPYLWRVRRVDSSGNLGPWSAPASFISTGTAPRLITPKAGVWVNAWHSYFEWTEVPGAVAYNVQFTGPGNNQFTTQATAYAPTSPLASGTYTWKVTAVDAGGNALATSGSRRFKVDAIPPTVTKITPAQLKPKSIIKATFSEKVHGVSTKSIKLFKLTGKSGHKKVKVPLNVKLVHKGRKAVIDPKHLLHHGNYLLVFVSSKIKDRAGNRLVPSSVTPTLKVPVRLAAPGGRRGLADWRTALGI